MEDAKLIRIFWKDKKENHIIQKVRLNVENLEKVYEYVKRTPKSELVRGNIEMLQSYYTEMLDLNLTVSAAFTKFLKERLEEKSDRVFGWLS